MQSTCTFPTRASFVSPAAYSLRVHPSMPAKQSRDGPLVCRVAPRGTTSLKLFLVASGLEDLAHAARRPARRQARGVGWEGTRVGAGGGVRLQSASVLVAGRGARAHAMHEGLVGLALAGLGPPLAALVVVVAHRRAHLRREEGHTSVCACIPSPTLSIHSHTSATLPVPPRPQSLQRYFTLWAQIAIF